MSRLQRRSVLVAILALASVGLIVLSQTTILTPVRNVLMAPLLFVQRGVAGLWRNTAHLLERDPAAAECQARNAQLEVELQTLQGRVTQLEEENADMQLLAALLNYARTQTSNEYLAANVIGRDPSPYLNYLILDRGTDAGVLKDMPVVTEQGLVGHVTEVTSSAAKVMLVVDPDSAVNGRLQQSREEGMVVGLPAGGLRLQYISQRVNVAPGELVLTSGLGGRYPPDLVVGSVNAVQKLNYEVLQQAELTPAVEFSRLEIVLIITSFQPVDLTPFSASTVTP